MKKMLFVGLSALGLLVGCRSFWTDEVRLAKDGQALARIVIAKDATRAARFGATDLKWHLDKITGANFEIITDDQVSQPLNPSTSQPSQLLINVGFTKFTQAKPSDFKKQQFLVDIRKDGIDLVGTDFKDPKPVNMGFELDAEGRVTGKPGNWPDIFKPQCSMYAVYEFLENVVGVRWIDPSDCGWSLPSDADLAVPVKRVFTEPFIRYRGGTGIDGMGWYDAHVNARKECRAIEFSLSPDRTKNDPLWTHQNRLFLLRHRAGGEKAEANHSFYRWYDRYWQKSEREPWLWVAEHKDWFAQGYQGKPPQLCYSNPEVIAQAIKDGRDYLDNGGYPVYNRKGEIVGRDPKWGENQFCLEPMDAGSMCKCDKCQKAMACDKGREASAESTYWFTFVNAVAKELKKSHPDKLIGTLAYGGHEGLPQGVTLEDNVLVYFCLSANRTMFGRTIAEHPQFRRMTEWRKAYPNQPLAIWFYNTFPDEHYRGLGIKGVPGFFARDAEAQYRFLKEMNARGGIFHCGFNGEVDNYMQLEWMIDPDRMAAEMLDEYFAPYGETGKWLKKFYSIVEERYTKKGVHVKGAELGQESCWGHIIPAGIFAELTACMEKAIAAAKNEKEKKFAQVWKLAVYDYMKEGSDTYAVREASKLPEWTAKRIAPCGGEIARVDWSKLELIKSPTYFNGSTNETPIRAELRFAHDGQWLYVELTEYLDTTMLENAAQIVCNDEVEVKFALQKASPYRNWFCAPDGRMKASSCHEMNFRWNVTDVEHGCPKFGANYTSDVSKPDRWVMRWAFPFDRMLNRKVEPGMDIYFNAVPVLGPKYVGQFGLPVKWNSLIIAPLVTFASVHTPDRAATLHLEK